MPQVLELKPLKDKHLKLILVESEFPVDWWFDAPEEVKEDLVWNLHLISKEYLQLIEGLVDKYQPDFAMEEKPTSWEDGTTKDDPLETLFKSKKLPFGYADIDENAKDYLSSALEEHRTTLKHLESRIREEIQKSGKIPEEDEDFQRLVLWKEYLQKDYNQQEDEVRFNVREAWMMMNILNMAKHVDGKKLKGLFICDLRHFNGLERLAGDLDVDTEKVRIKRSIKTETIEKELEKDVQVELEK